MLYSHPTEFEDAVILLLHRLFGIGLQVAHRAGDDGIDASYEGNPANLLFREYWIDKAPAKWVVQVKVTFDRDAKRSILRAIAKENLSRVDANFYVLVTNVDLKRKSIDDIREALKDRLPSNTEVLVWAQRKLEMLACLSDSKNFIPSLGMQAVFRSWEEWLRTFEANPNSRFPLNREDKISNGNSWYYVLDRRCSQGPIALRCWDFASLLQIPYDFHVSYRYTGVRHIITNRQYRQLLLAAYEIQNAIDRTGARPNTYSATHLLGNLLEFGKATPSVAEGLMKLANHIPDNDDLVLDKDPLFVFPIRTVFVLSSYLLPEHDPAVLIYQQMKIVDSWIWDYARRFLYAAYIDSALYIMTQNDVYDPEIREEATLSRLVTKQELKFLESYLQSNINAERRFGNWWYGQSVYEYEVGGVSVLGNVSVKYPDTHFAIPDGYCRCYVIPYKSSFTSADRDALDPILTSWYLAREFDELIAIAIRWQMDGQITHLAIKNKTNVFDAIRNESRRPKMWRDI